MALFGIADDAVLHAVESVAGIHYCLMQRIHFGLGERRVVLHQLESALHAGRVQVNMWIGRRAHGGSVEILGEFCDLDESLAAASGASVVIRVLGTLAIERGS